MTRDMDRAWRDMDRAWRDMDRAIRHMDWDLQDMDWDLRDMNRVMRYIDLELDRVMRYMERDMLSFNSQHLPSFNPSEPQLGPLQAIMSSSNSQPIIDFPPTPSPTKEFANDGCRCRNPDWDSPSPSQGSGTNVEDVVDTPRQVRSPWDSERASSSYVVHISSSHILFGYVLFCFWVCVNTLVYGYESDGES